MRVAHVLFSWFKHEFIGPDVSALNATISVHSMPKTIIGKEYCVWRLQIIDLADSSTIPYVLMLERWMQLFWFILGSTVLLVRDIIYEDCKCVI